MELKNIYRREETRRVRVERIISGYVKHCHPEVYSKAHEFYQHLDAVYPDKKDLRRTNEFLALMQEPARPVRTRHTRKKTITDNMILQIPLIQQGERAEKTTTQPCETPAYQHEITVETTVEEESSNQTEITKETTVETADLPPINDEILEEIMRGLREDPDIQNFFDDLDFQFDDCPLW